VPASEAIVRSLPPRLVENVQVSSFRGEDAGEAVDRALRLGVPHGAIYLRAAIVAIGQTRDQVNSVLTIEVRGWDVALRVPEVDVYLMTFDEAGAPLGSTRFTPADATQISKAADWRWHGGHTRAERNQARGCRRIGPAFRSPGSGSSCVRVGSAGMVRGRRRTGDAGDSLCCSLMP
jgi:hypothetical protein